jgi:hypothetical protein
MQSLNNPPGFYLFSLSLPESKLSDGFGKINNPAIAGLFKLCGERGIRTPGTVTHTAV